MLSGPFESLGMKLVVELHGVGILVHSLKIKLKWSKLYYYDSILGYSQI